MGQSAEHLIEIPAPPEAARVHLLNALSHSPSLDRILRPRVETTPGVWATALPPGLPPQRVTAFDHSAGIDCDSAERWLALRFRAILDSQADGAVLLAHWMARPDDPGLDLPLAQTWLLGQEVFFIIPRVKFDEVVFSRCLAKSSAHPTLAVAARVKPSPDAPDAAQRIRSDTLAHAISLSPLIATGCYDEESFLLWRPDASLASID